MKRIAVAALVLTPLAAFAPLTAFAGQRLPARFDADRVVVTPIAENGQPVTFYTDSGGGLFVTETAATRLRLEPAGTMPPDEDDKDTQPLKTVRFPSWKSGAAIPLPLGSDGRIAVFANAMPGFHDGILGEKWFGGRVWTWDYPARTLTLEDARWRAADDATRVALGFKKAPDGKRDNNFARVAMKVDGESIDMLLDTGATGHPTAAGRAADPSETVEGYRATSFITRSVLERWHHAHPDWRVIDGADDVLSAHHFDARAIEVPTVEIAGSRVGPVWFTERTDKNFIEIMSSMMDARVEGAIGGNALAHFEMTIDYPNAVAYFRCTRNCVARPRSAR